MQVGLFKDLFAFFYIHFRRLIIAFGFLAAISAVPLYLAEPIGVWRIYDAVQIWIS